MTTRKRKQASPGRLIDVLDSALPHIAIIVSGMLIVFFLIDRVNKPMAFMTNEFHKLITFALSLMAIYLAIRRIAQKRRQAANAARHHGGQTGDGQLSGKRQDKGTRAHS